MVRLRTKIVNRKNEKAVSVMAGILLSKRGTYFMRGSGKRSSESIGYR